MFTGTFMQYKKLIDDMSRVLDRMVQHKATGVKFKDIIEDIFSKKSRKESHQVIDHYSSLWRQMSSGSQGFSGKKTVNAKRTMFNLHFEEDNSK